MGGLQSTAMFSRRLFFDARLRQPILFAQPMTVLPFVVAPDAVDVESLAIRAERREDCGIRAALQEQLIDFVADRSGPPSDFAFWTVGRLGASQGLRVES